MVNMVS